MYLTVQTDLQVCGIFGDMNEFLPQDRSERSFVFLCMYTHITHALNRDREASKADLWFAGMPFMDSEGH